MGKVLKNEHFIFTPIVTPRLPSPHAVIPILNVCPKPFFQMTYNLFASPQQKKNTLSRIFYRIDFYAILLHTLCPNMFPSEFLPLNLCIVEQVNITDPSKPPLKLLFGSIKIQPSRKNFKKMPVNGFRLVLKFFYCPLLYPKVC